MSTSRQFPQDLIDRDVQLALNAGQALRYGCAMHTINKCRLPSQQMCSYGGHFRCPDPFDFVSR